MIRPPGKRTILDRVMAMVGVPAATKHDEAMKSAEVAIRVSMQAHARTEELTDAIRQLEHSMDRKR